MSSFLISSNFLFFNFSLHLFFLSKLAIFSYLSFNFLLNVPKMFQIEIKTLLVQSFSYNFLLKMSDCSDPEDEIIEHTSDSHGHSHAPGHGHSHVHRPARPQVPEGAKNWPAIYPIYLNKFRTREQVRIILTFV